MFGNLFGSHNGSANEGGASPKVSFDGDGAHFELPGVSTSDWFAAPFAHGPASELGALLAMVHMEGFGSRQEARFSLPWPDLYTTLRSSELPVTPRALQLPPIVDHRPELSSRGSLGDEDFLVVLHQWVDGSGAPVKSKPTIQGAVISVNGRPGLLQQPVWELLRQLQRFHETPKEQRDLRFRERSWSAMRKYAVSTHAPLSDYLNKTIVVTPEKLQLQLRQVQFGDSTVVEVIPTFDGAPPGWLRQLDQMPIQDAYSVPDGACMTKVLISDDVKSVLAEIKRMPGRRVSGARAEAFVRNPFGVLGPEAEQVLDPRQIESALATAGIAFQRFLPELRREADGAITWVGLRVHPLPGQDDDELIQFATPNDLDRFCIRLHARIEGELQCCAWEGCDLEITGDTPEHLRQLRGWQTEWQQGSLWSAAEVLDLSKYSDRVEGIGAESKYIVPILGRRSVELDWFVDNVLYGLQVSSGPGEPTVQIQLAEGELDGAILLLEQARARGANEVTLPTSPHPVPIANLEAALQSLLQARDEVQRKTFQPDAGRNRATSAGSGSGSGSEKKHLILKSNINEVDHLESRAQRLSLMDDAVPALPSCLRPEVSLKPHQLRGVAWLQHLWNRSPQDCRGSLLADDMGLGKTLQLLTFIAHGLESTPKLDPILIVAPLALLENWKAEVQRFFQPGALKVLTLYGKQLSAARVPKTELDPELSAQGVTRLLRKDWLGDANIVLTTYETMRDLEFSLAAQPWSIMVCDEAQKIKVPGAMVTRTAKKQKVRFRIACTGTPVENTLMDLWCLFDFIQPGLLGALNSFSRSYRKPIEAKTEEQRAKVDELRALIEPQILRRTKMEVARDILPAKREDDSCRALPMSSHQHALYRQALQELKRQRDSNPSAQLQTLHNIRRICSDPHWKQTSSALTQPLPDLLADSPKLAWLVRRLEALRSSAGAGEKVIVFCEFRDLQLLLQRVIAETMKLHPSIVNGDTTATLEAENSRQKLIDQFQQKPGFNVIILSPLAVGFGVNIQAANHVIHFTRTWNPAKEDQATDRAYRIGQERDVTVYYPSVVGTDFKSFDTILHELLEWKRGIAGDMLNGSGDLSMDDFDDLVPA
jgi:hypothetical protein